jgi:DNA-directed RNA polymerase subunit RPC12/RpoP
MGIFGAFKKKGYKKGYCAKCGKKLSKSNKEPLRGLAYETDLSNMTARIGLELQKPGYACSDCGAVICKGCITLGALNKCPICNSENMEMFND